MDKSNTALYKIWREVGTIMHFGFSYIGLLYLVMLMTPNIIWTKHQPKDYEKYAKNENKILLMMERIGEIAVSCLVLIFSDFNIRAWSIRSWCLLISFGMMVLYEIYFWRWRWLSWEWVISAFI